MRSHRAGSIRLVASALLVAGLAGCAHKAPPPVPQASTAPPLPPVSMTKVPPVPSMPAPTQPQVRPPGSDTKAQQTPPEQPKRPRRLKRHPVTGDTSGNPVVATATPLPSPSPAAQPGPPAQPTLGQLSPGGGADTRERAAMAEQIHIQEVRLSKIKHPLSDEDEAITKQVEAFLNKARQAVVENDLDGAQTLTIKAKVLLDELSQS